MKEKGIGYVLAYCNVVSLLCAIALPTFLIDKSDREISILHLGSTIPNDTNYQDNEWAYDSISAEEAWDISTGNNDVSVAVIDTGVKTTHNDLINNINLNNIVYLFDNSNSTISSNDWTGHGSNVAGIIGSKGNNNLGVCGVCWNVNIIPLSYINVYGIQTSSNVAAAINFAEEHEIPIINFSSYYTGSIDSDVENAIRNYSGLFVCCAGNEGQNIDTNQLASSYPTQLSNVDNLISVGSLSQNGTIKDSSNYGATSVDLFAPGDNVLTTANVQDAYESFSGTSCATPFVAGAAALLLSINPSLTPLQIKSAILNNVDQSSIFEGKCSSGGKLNIHNAALSVIPTLSTSSERNVDGFGYNWEKFTINTPSTYSFSLSGYQGLTLKIADFPTNDSFVLTTATIESGQSSVTINYTFIENRTYYIQVQNAMSFGVNYVLSKAFLGYHYHSFHGTPLIPVDNIYHGNLCSCGFIGNLSTHLVRPNNPTRCFLCGGIALLPNNLDLLEKTNYYPIGIDSYKINNGIIVVGEIDYLLGTNNSSYLESLYIE